MYAELLRISCTKCGKKKEESAFYNWKHERRCKRCISKARKSAYAKDSGKTIARVTRYRKANPDKIKDTKLRQERGISLEAYRELLKGQGFACRICRKAELTRFKGSIMSLAVDHDHKTGKIRGLLCLKCNRGIGLFEENLEFLYAAILYLRSNRSKG